MCDCENCKHSKLVTIEGIHGKQHECECLCPYEDMSYECAVETGQIKDWKVERGIILQN